MSQRSARLVAAGFWTFGVLSLVMLAINLNPMGLILLGMGAVSLTVATWINAVTAVTSTSPPPTEPRPPDSGGRMH
jgi:hypothetical protein